MASWKKILTSGSAAEVSSLKVDGTVGASIITGSISGSFTGDGSGLTGVGTDIDTLSALGGASLHQTEDHFLFSDNGTEKKVTFSNLEDSIFGNVSGDATIAAGGAVTLAANSVSQTQLDDDAVGADELASNAVVNDSIASNAAIDMDKLDGDSLAGSITSFAQDDLLILSDTDDSGDLKSMTTSNFEDTIFGNVSGDATIAAGGALTIAATSVENGMLAGSIANAKLSNSSVTVGSTAIALGATSTTLAGMTGIDFTAANQAIGASIGANNLTLGGGTSTVIVAGDLTVNGTTTTVATTNTVVEDQLLFLATGSKDANKDAGIVVQHGSTDLQGAALYHDTNDSRWAVHNAVAHNATAITALEYVTTVKSSTDFPDTTSGSYGVGEMWVDTDTNGGEIYIRVS